MLKLPMSKITITRQDLIDHENEVKEKDAKSQVNSSIDNDGTATPTTITPKTSKT